ncbi:recombination protein RecT [Staphylococcus aureus DAR3847]|nr:recombination protein RecT [Staphylococcus aureus DAR3847]
MKCKNTTKTKNALNNITQQGKKPKKKQDYITNDNKKQQQQRNHHKTMTVKKHAAAQEEINQEIKKEDKEKKEKTKKGKIKEIKHKQDFGNRNKQNIIGAYATIVFKDERKNYTEIMTIEQIKQAWKQSQMIKNEKAKQNAKKKKNPKEEMAKKTVINRAAKRYINTSTDSNLFKYAQESEQRQRKEVLDAEVEENANQEQLDFEQPVLEEAQYTELENDKPIDVSDFEEIKEPATEKESEEEPF